jgi:hypothetical protein
MWKQGMRSNRNSLLPIVFDSNWQGRVFREHSCIAGERAGAGKRATQLKIQK